jgi:hypothetical protein
MPKDKQSSTLLLWGTVLFCYKNASIQSHYGHQLAVRSLCPLVCATRLQDVLVQFRIVEVSQPVYQ